MWVLDSGVTFATWLVLVLAGSIVVAIPVTGLVLLIEKVRGV